MSKFLTIKLKILESKLQKTKLAVIQNDNKRKELYEKALHINIS